MSDRKRKRTAPAPGRPQLHVVHRGARPRDHAWIAPVLRLVRRNGTRKVLVTDTMALFDPNPFPGHGARS